MTKKIKVLKMPWGGYEIQIFSDTGAFIRDFRTSRKLSNYSDEELDRIAKILDIKRELLNKAVQQTINNSIKKIVKYREDLGVCGCGCGEHLQKKGKKFVKNHYNLIVKEIRDCLKTGATKQDRDWAISKMQELQFSEKNLYVGGKLPKGVKL